MSTTTTLATLRSGARERSDMRESKFYTDSEVDKFINKAVAKLHDILVSAYGEEYNVLPITFTTDGSAAYDLTSSSIIPNEDFYKLKGVDAKINSGKYSTIHPFMFSERNRFQNGSYHSFLGAHNIRYRIIGNKLYFMPEIDSGIEIQLWYTPTLPVLSSDSDTLRDYNHYSEIVEIDAAIQMKIGAEEDVTDLRAERAILVERIETSSTNRDSAEGEAVSDVSGLGEDIPVSGSI